MGLSSLWFRKNFSKEEIYKTALAFNVYWFPQTYLDIAFHFDKAEQDYSKKSPKELLSKTFSSAMGYQTIREKLGDIKWPALQGGEAVGHNEKSDPTYNSFSIAFGWVWGFFKF